MVCNEVDKKEAYDVDETEGQSTLSDTMCFEY